MVREVLSDKDNRLSSKRIVVFVAFLLVGAAFIGDLFFKYSISENTYNGMMWIVISGLGIVGSEKFAGKNLGGVGRMMPDIEFLRQEIEDLKKKNDGK